MKAVLSGVWIKDRKREEIRDSLRELGKLVEAVGGKALGYVIQKRTKPDPRFYIGEGKARELKEIVKGIGADAVVFDDPLTPSQIRNLEKTVGVKILDRTDLVLEIFSARARSKEAKLQVELAKLTHELPRLYGRGKKLSRLGGRVGTRGPGEQEAEVKRRTIKARIHQIKKELKEVRKMKKHQRKRRIGREKGEEVIRVALVGYTNAGKSTLLQRLTARRTLIADLLFASLDTTTSSRKVNGDIKLIITDTVGFINKLPTELIESFRTTLEEVLEADIILLVADISDERWLDHIHSVRNVLTELGVKDKPIIYVLNKADRIIEAESEIGSLPHPAFVDGPAVVVSAHRGWNIDSLLMSIVKTAEAGGILRISKIASEQIQG